MPCPGVKVRKNKLSSRAEMSGDRETDFFPFEVNEKQLRDWHRTYRIPDEIEFFVPGPNDQVDDPSLGCVALNQVVLTTGLRLSFPRIVRKFLYEWGIAPTQLCPNGWRILIGFIILWD
ncbi:Uncharacterized protein Adt_27882 [Abeliophyllum distichum]|uniref:Uncharacterized protein n=1 Tax=Abeliophyllum distichum TaxID=126358 RepID=A0ABD1RW69_9LAMI